MENKISRLVYSYYYYYKTFNSTPLAGSHTVRKTQPCSCMFYNPQRMPTQGSTGGSRPCPLTARNSTEFHRFLRKKRMKLCCIFRNRSPASITK